MTDLDLSAAVEAALWAWIESATVSVTRENVSQRVLDLNRHRAEAAIRAALPLILAQVETRVTPSWERLTTAIALEFEGCGEAWIDDSSGDRLASVAADAVLALLPGKTEQEVRVDERQKVAMEVRKSANLLHPDAVENGAVTIDSLIGFINDLAARIDRGGEQND